MNEPDALARLASMHGVQTAYVNYEGRTVDIEPGVLRGVLAALGVDLRNLDAARAEAERATWERVVEPVVVAWEGEGVLELRVPSAVRAPRIAIEIEDEAGTRVEVPVRASRVAGRVTIGNDEVTRRRVRLPRLAPGYYTAHVRVDGDGGALEGSALVIAAPREAYQWQHARAFGVFAPLYSLRSTSTGGVGTTGIGNLGELRRLIEWEAGGHIVGTLPLLATWHDDEDGVSPYSPQSRLAWDELYLDLRDVRDVPELASPEARRALEAARPALEALSAAPLVDYAGTERALAPVLEACARAAFEAGSTRGGDLERWRLAHPELDAYASYRGARAVLGPAWTRWSGPARAGRLEAGQVDETVRRMHLYAQFALDQQLEALATLARGKGGGGLYLDLPLGVHREGFDAWRYPEAFVAGLDTGAPPDKLFGGGQNWQFAPPSAAGERATGYAYLRASIRAHVRHAGVLRIDHVMGLHRRYVIPRGAASSEGTYLQYRADEAWAILSLESHRAGTVLVGEDLGTVPAEVRRAMRRHGVGRSYVVEYEARARGTALPTPPRGSVAALNTHDMPPFASWARGSDLDTLFELGLMTRDDLAGGVTERASVVGALARFLGTAPGDERAMLRACLEYLGRSEAGLVLVSLDDLLGRSERQNLPGTTREHPNWRRRLPPLEELMRDETVLALLSALAAARGLEGASAAAGMPS